MMVSKRLVFRIFAGILAAALVGCAEEPPPPTPEEVVRERAQAWAETDGASTILFDDRATAGGSRAGEWHEATVDLSPFAGRTTRLRLVTEVGQDAAVDGGVECLDPAAQHLGISGDVGNGRHRNPGAGEDGSRPSR